jgi:hypothetical protein
MLFNHGMNTLHSFWRVTLFEGKHNLAIRGDDKHMGKLRVPHSGLCAEIIRACTRERKHKRLLAKPKSSSEVVAKHWREEDTKCRW